MPHDGEKLSWRAPTICNYLTSESLAFIGPEVGADADHVLVISRAV